MTWEGVMFATTVLVMGALFMAAAARWLDFVAKKTIHWPMWAASTVAMAPFGAVVFFVLAYSYGK